MPHVYAVCACCIYAACVHAARLVQVAGERVCRVAAVSVADVRHTLALIAPVQGEGEGASDMLGSGARAAIIRKAARLQVTPYTCRERGRRLNHRGVSPQPSSGLWLP
jgi:hypothetical protein